MGISFTDFTGGSSKANNFTINVGSSGNNVFELDRTYDDGSYAITIVSGDSSFDIYAIGTDGSYVGYTNSNKIDISDKFNKLVILGLPNNDEIFFEYRGKINTPLSSGSVPSAGAYVSSVSLSSLEDVDDTTTITGGNFANDIEVYFIGQSNTEAAAKNIVVTSVNQLIVTRPDSFDPNDSPYTIKVVNPGIPTPDGSNLFKLSNSVTAGAVPAWLTGSTVFYNLSQPTSISLSASDVEGSDISYSVISGNLPAGLILDETTGIISGSFTGSSLEGDSTAVTFRATDAGGNYIDKEISMVANATPVWTTDTNDPLPIPSLVSYSYQLLASSGAAGGTLSYSLVSGALPTSITLDSSGLISGTTSDGAADFTFTVRVTDEANSFAEKTFVVSVSADIDVEYLVVAGGGGGGQGPGATDARTAGGGGAGGYRSSVIGESSGGGESAETVLAITPYASYSLTVGAGGTGGDGTGGDGTNGNSSSFASIASVGGGVAHYSDNNGYGADGGSGGGGSIRSSRLGGSGTAGQGFDGGVGRNSSSTNQRGGGGGGAGEAGASGDSDGGGGDGVQSSITGVANYYAGGGGGGSTSSTPPGGLGGGGNGGNRTHGSSATVNTGGGGGGACGYFERRNGGNGGSGIVAIKYPDTHVISAGPGLVFSTTSSGGYRVSTFTGGSDTVTFEAA